jgi:hypothetical protein
VKDLDVSEAGLVAPLQTLQNQAVVIDIFRNRHRHRHGIVAPEMARWTMANTEISASASAFTAWCSTRVKAVVHSRWACPPLIIAIAAWNGAHGRDSLEALPPDEGAIFEPWYRDLVVEIINEMDESP